MFHKEANKRKLTGTRTLAIHACITKYLHTRLSSNTSRISLKLERRRLGGIPAGFIYILLTASQSISGTNWWTDDEWPHRYALMYESLSRGLSLSLSLQTFTYYYYFSDFLYYFKFPCLGALLANSEIWSPVWPTNARVGYPANNRIEPMNQYAYLGIVFYMIHYYMLRYISYPQIIQRVSRYYHKIAHMLREVRHQGASVGIHLPLSLSIYIYI